MPTYEYRCTECGDEFEEFQAISDPPIAICSACGGKTQRLISGGAGLIFKGSGFYITDYKRKGERQTGTKNGSGVTKPSTPPTDSK